MKKYVFILLGLTVFLAGCGVRTPTEPAYSVSGRIVDSEGHGVPGVTLVAQGGGIVAETRADGSWRMDSLAGRVTIVPHVEGGEFEPASRSVTESIEDLLFRLVPPSYSLSGRVVDAQGAGVPGVTVIAEATQTRVITGSDGRWRIAGLREPTKVVPQKAGGVFTPANRVAESAEEELNFQILNPIMGTAVVSREQARQWLKSRFVADQWLELVDLYYDIAPLYGIRADVALSQAAHETGFWRFGNLVEPWQNNFAGIGATGTASDGFTPLNGADPNLVRFERGVHGAIFATPAAGVEAQIQHLYAYATVAPLPAGRPLLSPRFVLVRRGTAPYVEYLGARQNPAGVGWATDAQYGFKIINSFINPMLATTVN